MKIVTRIIASTAAAVALSSAVCGAAFAATVSPHDGSTAATSHGAVVSNVQELPGTHYIEMDINNNSNQPLTLLSSSHDYAGTNNGHWQERPLATLAADSSETVTAYTGSVSGFEVSLDYGTPGGQSVLFQAVYYIAKSDNAGYTKSLDPTLNVSTSLQTGGWAMDMAYYINPAN